MKILAFINSRSVRLYKADDSGLTCRYGFIGRFLGEVADIEVIPSNVISNEWEINFTTGNCLFVDLIQKGD